MTASAAFPSLRAILALLLVPLALSGCRSAVPTAAAGTEEPPAVDVVVQRVETGMLESTIEVSGTLAPRARVPVKPRLPGPIESLHVQIGDRVRPGQPIATIDRRQVDAEADAADASVAVARAGLDNATAALANAEAEQTRARRLFEAGALPRQRLDAAETAFRSARAQRDLAEALVRQAEATARHARDRQRDATVTAPLGGAIVARHYDPGSTPGDLPLVVIADLAEMKLEAGVSELEAGRLRVGLPARVAVQALPDRSFTGRLAAIAPEVDGRNRHFRIEVRIDNPDAALLSGMYATARLVLDTVREALVLPHEAVLPVEGRRVVMRVAGGRVEPVEVTMGPTDGTRVQILSGLSPGDLVVADARVSPPAGARVRPVIAP